jgi:fatty-acyl-CoA synthase
MPPALAQKLHDRCGLTFLQGYGLTEVGCQSHVNPPQHIKTASVGIPIQSVESIIVDPDTMALQPANEAGEILIRGPNLFKGYWNNPAANDECFVEIDGKIWFRSGDIGWIDEDGYFYFAERLKRTINAAGLKIWPAEVEQIMYRHPSVQDCIIVASPDARRGETVKAFIVKTPGQETLTGQEIIDWARTQVAVYKAPRIVEFVEELPRGLTGKLDWRSLQEREFANAAAASAGEA